MRYGDSAARQAEYRDEKSVFGAQECLLEIQRKKLLDTMCQWNANLFKHETIQCSWDFYYWDTMLLSCPFLTPITQQEYNLYLRFAATDNFDYGRRVDLMECNGCIDRQEDDPTQLPDWFEFENLHTGNSQYLVLPNLRMPKENMYRQLAFKEKHPIPYAAPAPDKPYAQTLH
jgi:hypothetical protein